jgi:hypothetical protein
MTATLKSKQTSIATVRYHLLPVASLLTPLILHYPLPLREKGSQEYKDYAFVECAESQEVDLYSLLA